MQKIFNQDNFNWFIGVVEDRIDPEQLGRCRVRVYGYHSVEKNILPTEDLPWAIPIQPITSAASSGKGSAPLGPLPGTWVVGFFLDGSDMQQPAFFGTIGTKAAKISFVSTPAVPGSPEKPVPKVQNRNKGEKLDDSGNTVKDKQGLPIKQGSSLRSTGLSVPIPGIPSFGFPPGGFPTIPSGTAFPWKLGTTSKQFDAVGKKSGFINEYKESFDNRGALYGTYKLASFLPRVKPDGNPRPSSFNSPVKAFIKSGTRFSHHFYNFKKKIFKLEPGTKEFDSKWKGLSISFKKEWEDAQYKFIKDNYYQAMLDNLRKENLDLSTFGPAVKDLVWSTAFHIGPNKTFVFIEPLKDKAELTDKDIVNTVSEFKMAKVDELFESTPKVLRDQIFQRFKTEQTELLKLIT